MVLEEDYTKQNAEREIGYPQAKEKRNYISQKNSFKIGHSSKCKLKKTQTFQKKTQAKNFLGEEFLDMMLKA